MPLPEIVTPEFQTSLPSTGEEVFFRPFLVKEEKMLLMAQEGKDKREINNAVVKIINACIKTPLDILNLPTFDIEWLFLQLRAKSVSEVIKLNLRHTVEGCDHLNKVEIPIQDIKVQNNPEHKNILMIDEDSGLGMSLNYPTLGLADNLSDKVTNEQIFNLISKCVKNVFDKDQIYNDFTQEELDKFIGELPQEFLLKFMEFFKTMPKLEHTLEYTCEKCKKKVTHKINGLTDFFL
tara:strand:- start:1830 stop:2537 length:708 start_codon:yes stop_codon:yes gene_type:complete